MNEPTAISIDWSPLDWARAITASWRESVNGIFKTGHLLQQAKDQLGRKSWEECCNLLPFTVNTADRLIAIANDSKLSAHMQALPPHWGTLYELTKLKDEEFEEAVEEGTINPEMERRDIAAQVKQSKRAEKERKLGGVQLALPDRKYGVILADPPWRFEPYSRETGMDRAADNHYPTSSLDAIRTLDVASIAADDCVLFLWATVPMLVEAIGVIAWWGFDYKSHAIWVKRRDDNKYGVAKLAIGTGYWFRNCHELLLVGVRGKIPAPAPGMQWPSVIESLIGEHSAKPEGFHEMIEEFFPTLPKIELNRRGPARPGWDAWGDESEDSGADAARFPVSDGEAEGGHSASPEPARARLSPDTPARAGSPIPDAESAA